MKTVIFVRHGKSSWDYQVNDKDRPLKERGINDAHLVATELKKKDIQIDASFSSPANRALHTGMIFLRTLNFNFDKFQVTNMLYDFSGESALRFLKSLSEDFSSILIFGHNYAFTSLVNMMGDQYLDNLPTSGMAIIQFDVEKWRNLDTGKTTDIIVPKDFK